MDENLKNKHVHKLTELYREDINTILFEDELRHFLHFIDNEEAVCPSRSPTDLYKCLHDGLQATFPNVDTILKKILTIPVTNASGERSFSLLKRVKNYSRNSMTQELLTNSAILTIESANLKNVTYDSIIDDFVKKKCRKKTI